MGSSSITIPKPCAHFSEFKHNFGPRSFENLPEFIKPGRKGRARVRKDDTELPRCSSCDGYRGRLFICLICSSISCSTHFVSHSQSEDRHSIAVDIERLELYCWECNDQVYDSEFDGVIESERAKRLSVINNGGVEVSEGRTSKRANADSWIVDDLKQAKQSGSFDHLGLRGLTNLGSTCFMNSMLQALLHAPPLAHYFLAERHIRDQCPENGRDNVCLLCELGDVFKAMLSDDHTPYSATQFVYSFWRIAPSLAFAEQNDAQEFFVALVNGIHAKYEEDNPKTSGKDDADCQCIAHRAFSGLWRSDAVCSGCGYTSTSYEPHFNISLGIPTSSSSSKGAANESVKPNEQVDLPTLLDCLEFYTKAEKVELGCLNCEALTRSKQISIATLPVVLCLHFTRALWCPKTVSKKDHRHVLFPFELDVTAFLSSSVIKKRNGNRINTQESRESDSSAAAYKIFAVMCHHGTMLDGGHYLTYLRINNQWYECSDGFISEVDEETVRASHAFMLFYVQSWLDEARTSPGTGGVGASEET